MLIPADSSVYQLDIDLLVGRIPPEELAGVIGTVDTPDTIMGQFAARAAEAEAVWYYDGSGLMDNGLRIGEEGLIAISGCVAQAQQTLVIHN